MPKQPIELMFGAYRRQLLATLLLRPDEKFHVRELGRMTGMSAGSIHRELKVMSETLATSVLFNGSTRVLTVIPCSVIPILQVIIISPLILASVVII